MHILLLQYLEPEAPFLFSFFFFFFNSSVRFVTLVQEKSVEQVQTESFFFFFFLRFTYFVFGCTGSSLLCMGFL